MPEANTSQKVIVKSLFWKIFERLSVQGVNLIVQIILARILLPEDFGNLAIIVAITNYAAIFVQTGFATTIIQKKDIDDLDISTLFFTSLGLALFFYSILFLYAPLIADIYEAPELIWPLRVLGVLLFLNSINSVQSAIYSRRMEFKKIFIRSIIAVPISGIVGIILAIYGFGLWALVIHNILNVLIIILVMALDKTCWIKFQFSFKRLKTIFPFAFKIILTGVVTGGSDFIRTMIIGKKYDSEDLAYYDKAYTYSSYVTQVIGQSVTSVMLPSLSREQGNLTRLKAMSRKSVSISAFVMFPILLGVAAISSPFVLILLTEKWAACIPFLMVFCILRMPSFISNIDKQVYYALGKSGINLIYEIGLLIINVASLLVTVQFGVMWIAVGATIVEWFGCLIICFISAKEYCYSVKERLSDVIKPLCNSLLMFACVYSVQFVPLNRFLTMILQVLIGIVVYFILSVLTKEKSLLYIMEAVKNRRGESAK